MNCINLEDYRREARTRLQPEYFDYFDGGAQDEVTLRANHDAFDAIGLRPRVLTGGFGTTAEDELGIDLLGSALAMPVFISPTAFHRLSHSDGECASARAAQAAGTIMIVSMASTISVEKIVAGLSQTAETPKLWFQLYIQPDRGITAGLIARAEEAGCGALVVTADSPVFGRHERDLRHSFFDRPSDLHCAHLRVDHGDTYRKIKFDPTLSWRDIDWLHSVTRLPIVIKGIVHPEDARLAVAHGASAVFVSNHGGRQLDTVAASVALLPDVVQAVGGEVPVLLDGGIRRGTDVLKALALGATAVGIGRPVLWGLAVNGQAGVQDVLELLREDLFRSLELCGCRSLAELDPRLLFEKPTCLPRQ